jgi:two-component system, cell cycle sensor histidine kinase and response regulator CckA
MRSVIVEYPNSLFTTSSSFVFFQHRDRLPYAPDKTGGTTEVVRLTVNSSSSIDVGEKIGGIGPPIRKNIRIASDGACPRKKVVRRMGFSEQKIMVVEDEGLIAADLQSRLERAGYSVPPVAGTGAEALTIIRETAPDLVLMDIRLRGDLDGIEVAEQVRRELDIPVVYLTAYEDQETLARAGQSQAYGYIRKPIAAASLQGAIEIALSKYRFERHLREQRDWLKASFAAVPDAVLVTDNSGRICYLNRAAEEMTGQTPEQAVGHPSNDLLWLVFPDGEAVEDLVRAVLFQGETATLPPNVTLQGHLGRRYAVEGSVEPRRNGGHIEGVVVVLRDVTERRFAEEIGRQDNKHEALTRFADGVAGNVEPELKTLARQAAHLLGLLAPGVALRPAAEVIGSAATKVLAMTSDLRTFARPPKIELQPVWVNRVVAALEPAWRNVMPALTLQLDTDPRPAHANARELARILEIILLHARQNMRAGGSTWMDTSRTRMGGTFEWVRARVSYASAGETVDSVERAFDPSWEGKWEGLPLAYGITRQMGGVLTARYEGVYTVTFEILLPSVEAAATGVPAQWTERPVILLIEPDSAISGRLHAFFDGHGYNVLEAATCQEALQAAGLYEGHIPLMIANPAEDDPGRNGLAATLSAERPETFLRLFDGRWEERQNAAAIEPGHPVFGPELLAWVDSVLGPSRAQGWSGE